MKKHVNFWEAWNTWRMGQKKTLLGETVTIGVVIAAAISGTVGGVFSFLTQKILDHFWPKKTS